MQDPAQPESMDVLIGVDVGKGQRHAVALDRGGKRLLDRALPIAVARPDDIAVAYLPGLAMRRFADLHGGEAKTDARDAAIIAEAARSMPHALRSLRLADDALAELMLLCGVDDDLVAQITQASNRLRGLLTQINPALELPPGHPKGGRDRIIRGTPGKICSLRGARA